MYTERTFLLQRSWSEAALLLMRDLLPLMSPVGAYSAWSAEQNETLAQILSASARSTESVLLLCVYGQLWDAEPLIRSVMEGTLKFAYLLQSIDTFEDRHSEYAEHLFLIGRAKDHEKSKTFLDNIPSPNAPQWDPIREVLLDDEELAAIRKRFNKEQRRELENKWSFSGLIRSLTCSGDPLFARFPCFAHGYSISSHLLHADYAGTAIPLERDIRSEARREAIHLAHLSRLISDVFAFFQFRLQVGYRFIGQSERDLIPALSRISALLETHGDIGSQWWEKELASRAR